jgi:hypothetical protein
MFMKLSELQKEVNKDIDDSLPNADINGWLNRCLDDLTPVANYQKSAVINIVADQKEYPLPLDLVTIAFLIDGERQLSTVPINDFGNSGYKFWGNNIILQPVPKDAKTLDLYYQARLPHLVNADDVPAIPEEYHDLLVLYAVAKAKYQDEEESMQNNAMNEYYARKNEFIASRHSGEIDYIQNTYW